MNPTRRSTIAHYPANPIALRSSSRLEIAASRPKPAVMSDSPARELGDSTVTAREVHGFQVAEINYPAGLE
jgi:hypothetical protein